MKILSILTLSIFLLISCKNNPKQSQLAEKSETTGADTSAVYDYTLFEQNIGQLPSQAGLMQVADLQQRIANMLKGDYAKFQKDWNVETPIEIQDRILFATGCQKSECKANKYLLFLDLTDNNINIINFSYGQVRSWEEKAIIGLPSGFLKKYEEIREEQGL